MQQATWLQLIIHGYFCCSLFDRFFVTESNLHLYFRLNMSLQFLLVKLLFFFNCSGDFLFSVFLKMPVNHTQYRATAGTFY